MRCALYVLAGAVVTPIAVIAIVADQVLGISPLWGAGFLFVVFGGVWGVIICRDRTVPVVSAKQERMP